MKVRKKIPHEGYLLFIRVAKICAGGGLSNDFGNPHLSVNGLQYGGGHLKGLLAEKPRHFTQKPGVSTAQICTDLHRLPDNLFLPQCWSLMSQDLQDSSNTA